MKIKNKKDFILGLASVIISVWIIWLSMELPEAEYEGDPGPKLFPLIGAGLMLLFGIILMVKQEEPGKAYMTGAQWKSAGKIFAVYILALLLMYVFGWAVSVPVILFVLTFLMSKVSMPDASIKKRLITSLIWAVCAGAGVYLAYKIGLKAKLPKGLMNKFYKMWF